MTKMTSTSRQIFVAIVWFTQTVYRRIVKFFKQHGIYVTLNFFYINGSLNEWDNQLCLYISDTEIVREFYVYYFLCLFVRDVCTLIFLPPIHGLVLYTLSIFMYEPWCKVEGVWNRVLRDFYQPWDQVYNKTRMFWQILIRIWKFNI